MSDRDTLDLPYYVREPQVQRLPTLMNALREGTLRLPDFQRGFKWNDGQRLSLFDSIARGFPIGTVLVWRTSQPERIKTRDAIGPITTRTPTRTAELILDGHQRLTTLFSALGPDLPAITPALLSDPIALASAVYGGEQAARAWAVYFDPTEPSSERIPFHFMPRHGPPSPNLIPLFLLLKNVPLFRFLTALGDVLSAEQIARVEELASRVKDYAIPIVPIVTDDLDTAVRSFERINTGGTKLTQFDIAHALGRSENVDLDANFRAIHESLEPTGWGTIDDAVLGYTTKLAVGQSVYSFNARAFVNKLTEARDLPAQIGRAMVGAITFLRDRCGVFGAASIPYQFQLVLLAELFRRNANTTYSALEEGAERWFWMTTFSEHFASQRRIQTSMDVLDALARGVPVQRVVDDPTLDPLERINFTRARYKGFLLWFARHFDPRDAGDESMRVSQALGASGREVVHPLVPRAIVPPELLRDAGNVLLCPPDKVTALRELLLCRPEACSDAILDSHGIHAEAHAALVARDYVRFIETRRASLDASERAFVSPWGLEYVLDPLRVEDDEGP